MKDKLEDFVSTHRMEFDDLEPREQTWGDIEARIQEKGNSKTDFTIYWKIAAMVLLFLSLGLIGERAFYSPNSDETVADIESSFTQEMQAAESHYSQLIDKKKNQIKVIIASNQLDDVELLQDMDQLDEMYTQLKSDLASNQNDDRLLNAMINNLQLRVEILNRQLKILERISKKEEDEKIII